MRKSANNYGYSLMELIIAMAVIATISSIAVPKYNRYIESTRENVCMINRQTILYEYQVYCILKPETTLSDYLQANYDGDDGLICPSGGTIHASGSVDTVALTCSVHHASVTEPGLDLLPAELP